MELRNGEQYHVRRYQKHMHLIDNLDAKMYIFEEQFENMPEGTMTEKKPLGMENKIYKPNYIPS